MMIDRVDSMGLGATGDNQARHVARANRMKCSVLCVSPASPVKSKVLLRMGEHIPAVGFRDERGVIAVASRYQSPVRPRDIIQ